MSRTTPSTEKFDRLIDWNSSLTPRDQFFDAVNGDEQLRIKYGADITAPTLHLGHGVNLNVMRSMQDMGHKVVFLLGGFTTIIGDPTDRMDARKAVNLEEVEANKKKFVEQVGTILRMDDSSLFETRDNTEWWGDHERAGSVTPFDMFQLFSTISLRNLLSRDMFRRRMEQDVPINMAEFLYPVLQGYDSVMMESDITVVGSDQLFNESIGRQLQKEAGQKEQMIVCTKITPGLDGGPKQSKSIGNFVGLSHSPEEKFGRLMRLRDDLIGPWLRVYSDLPLSEIAGLEEQFADNPLALKERLATNVTTIFHGEEAAEAARIEFFKHMNKQLPTEIPEVRAPSGSSLREILMTEGYKSGDIKQLVDNGSVAIVSITADGGQEEIKPDQESIRDVLPPGVIIRIGKRKFFKPVSQ